MSRYPEEPSSGQEFDVISATATLLLFGSSVQVLGAAFILSEGPPHRAPFYTNIPFAICWVTLSLITVALFIFHSLIPFVDTILELYPLDSQFLPFYLLLLGIFIGGIVIVLLFQVK